MAFDGSAFDLRAEVAYTSGVDVGAALRTLIETRLPRDPITREPNGFILFKPGVYSVGASGTVEVPRGVTLWFLPGALLIPVRPVGREGDPGLHLRGGLRAPLLTVFGTPAVTRAVGLTGLVERVGWVAVNSDSVPDLWAHWWGAGDTALATSAQRSPTHAEPLDWQGRVDTDALQAVLDCASRRRSLSPEGAPPRVKARGLHYIVETLHLGSPRAPVGGSEGLVVDAETVTGATFIGRPGLGVDPLLRVRDVGELRLVGLSLVEGDRGLRSEPSRLIEVASSSATPSGVTLLEACSFTAQWSTMALVRSEGAFKGEGSVVFDRCVWSPAAGGETTEGLRVAEESRGVTVRRSRFEGTVTSMIALQRGALVVDACRIVARPYGPLNFWRDPGRGVAILIDMKDPAPVGLTVSATTSRCMQLLRDNWNQYPGATKRARVLLKGVIHAHPLDADAAIPGILAEVGYAVMLRCTLDEPLRVVGCRFGERPGARDAQVALGGLAPEIEDYGTWSIASEPFVPLDGVAATVRRMGPVG